MDFSAGLVQWSLGGANLNDMFFIFMILIISADASLSSLTSCGAIPASVSSLCTSLNPSIRCYFFLDLIPVDIIALESKSYNTIIYAFPSQDVIGKRPV